MNYQKCNRCGMPRRIGPLYTITVDGKETVVCGLCKDRLEGKNAKHREP